MENENIREKYEEKIYRLMYNTERKNVSQREENIFNNIAEYVKEKNIKSLYRYRKINEYSKKDIMESSIWLRTADELWTIGIQMIY